MGFRKWLAEKLSPSEAVRKDDTGKEIMQYELYGHAPGKGWTKIGDFPEPVEFEDFEDAEPGVTYKFQVRYKTGQVRQVWYRHMPGGEKIEKVDEFDAMAKAIEPLAKFGEKIESIRESIQGAFSWAMPPQPTGGGGPVTSPQYKGELPIWSHPQVPQTMLNWSPVLRAWTRDITAGIKEGILGGGPGEKPGPAEQIDASKYLPDAAAFLKKQESLEA